MTLRIKGATTIKGGSLAVGWVPTIISGLAAWYDASDDATITTATGVSQWNDKSGNGRNLAQATGSKQPTRANTRNGRSVLTFASASSQGLLTGSSYTTNAAYLTIFMVAKRTAPSTYNCVFASGYLQFSGIGLLFAGSTVNDWLNNDLLLVGNGWQASRAPRIISSSASTTDSAWHQFDAVIGSMGQAMSIDGSSMTVQVNTAASVPSVTAPYAVGYNVQFGDYFNGDIAEILVYSTASALTASDTATVRAYLKAKWATP